MPTVVIPRVLAAVTKDRREFDVGGTTVGDAIDALLNQCPQLRVHLFDERGLWRPHVRCFSATGRVDTRMGAPAGDRLTIIQAVSGG